MMQGKPRGSTANAYRALTSRRVREPFGQRRRPPRRRARCRGSLAAGLPSCRLSAQVLGAQNLVVTLWVRDYLEVQGHERELAARAPGSTVISRQAVVRTYKRLGHLLDESGRSRSVVPLPLWREA